ncbi:hypothetical protein J6590_042767 [Homalodisca vitripennis]|nr:hypothetical protein J6590_042767 [Homalodisca vitripennis]
MVLKLREKYKREKEVVSDVCPSPLRPLATSSARKVSRKGAERAILSVQLRMYQWLRMDKRIATATRMVRRGNMLQRVNQDRKPRVIIYSSSDQRQGSSPVAWNVYC